MSNKIIIAFDLVELEDLMKKGSRLVVDGLDVHAGIRITLLMGEQTGTMIQCRPEGSSADASIHRSAVS